MALMGPSPAQHQDNVPIVCGALGKGVVLKHQKDTLLYHIVDVLLLFTDSPPPHHKAKLLSNIWITILSICSFSNPFST